MANVWLWGVLLPSRRTTSTNVPAGKEPSTRATIIAVHQRQGTFPRQSLCLKICQLSRRSLSSTAAGSARHDTGPKPPFRPLTVHIEWCDPIVTLHKLPMHGYSGSSSECEHGHQLDLASLPAPPFDPYRCVFLQVADTARIFRE